MGSTSNTHHQQGSPIRYALQDPYAYGDATMDEYVRQQNLMRRARKSQSPPAQLPFDQLAQIGNTINQMEQAAHVDNELQLSMYAQQLQERQQMISGTQAQINEQAQRDIQAFEQDLDKKMNEAMEIKKSIDGLHAAMHRKTEEQKKQNHEKQELEQELNRLKRQVQNKEGKFKNAQDTLRDRKETAEKVKQLLSSLENTRGDQPDDFSSRSPDMGELANLQAEEAKLRRTVNTSEKKLEKYKDLLQSVNEENEGQQAALQKKQAELDSLSRFQNLVEGIPTRTIDKAIIVFQKWKEMGKDGTLPDPKKKERNARLLREEIEKNKILTKIQQLEDENATTVKESQLLKSRILDHCMFEDHPQEDDHGLRSDENMLSITLQSCELNTAFFSQLPVTFVLTDFFLFDSEKGRTETGYSPEYNTVIKYQIPQWSVASNALESFPLYFELYSLTDGYPQVVGEGELQINELVGNNDRFESQVTLYSILQPKESDEEESDSQITHDSSNDIIGTMTVSAQLYTPYR
ncbi:hypothetical protein BLNAU_2856 [Blattamonas nauphoetae]|uniref:RPGR-interacting protein 1 first C2 domain-containing protein n=1 Tax=Blattamonas nauphoetae TaxID=2049346 RepID=A0ABQ9YEZ0_9EUKA|nr:hypothetical protein BLNAU_2856 [Blattamonas nauphoetae]